MRLGVVALLLLAMGSAGCGGTLVLHKEDRTPPPPPPRTVEVREGCSRDEAVQVLALQANRNRITHLDVKDIDRNGNHWTIVLQGVDYCGAPAEVSGKVDRWTGELRNYKVTTYGKGHHHGKGHSHHDSHGHGHGHDDDDDDDD